MADEIQWRPYRGRSYGNEPVDGLQESEAEFRAKTREKKKAAEKSQQEVIAEARKRDEAKRKQLDEQRRSNPMESEVDKAILASRSRAGVILTPRQKQLARLGYIEQDNGTFVSQRLLAEQAAAKAEQKHEDEWGLPTMVPDEELAKLELEANIEALEGEDYE